MKMIRRFDVLSVMKLAGVIYGLIGLLIGVLFVIIGAFGLLVGRDQANVPFSGPLGLVATVALAVIFPIFYGIIGALMAGLMSAIYNIASKRFGGIRVELDESPAELALSPSASN